MAQPGYVFKDSGLTPPAVEQTEKKFTIIEPSYQTHDTSKPILQGQTEIIKKSFTADSHELSRQIPEIVGAVQTKHEEDVRVIGWHKPSREIPDPLIGGLRNGELFSLIRRFNKDVFAVKAIPLAAARGLDLNESWSDEYGTDKLPLNLQRAYKAIILPVASFVKHLSRLRSWKETRRTSTFCAIYIIAWILDLLLPLLLGVLIAVVSSQRARHILFPPVPLALVNSSTGELQKPQAGQLGTHNTLTGAPEKEEGEAIEEEAASFVSNIRHLVQRTVGMHHSQGNDGDPLEGKIPKPIRKAVKSIKAESSSTGQTTGKDDQTKEPMERVLWTKLRPEELEPIIKAFPHAVGEIVDNFERFTNAVSPTLPFSQLSFLRIDCVFAPLFLASFFISSYMVYKAVGLGIGFAFFGDPILAPIWQRLNQDYPNWTQLLEPKNNILRGIPTNSQRTITLLRIGEANRTPIPPVPSSKPGDQNQEYPVYINDIPLNGTAAEKISAITPNSSEETLVDGHSNGGNAKEPKHKRLSKISRIFKGNTKAVIETKLAADHLLAASGSEKAKGHLGVLPKPKNLIYTGPNFFKARFEGKKGWLYIIGDAIPTLSFTTQDPRSYATLGELESSLSIGVMDITALKRATAFVGKAAEMAAGWSNDNELLGSVEIEDRTGKIWRMTALPERDALFNRLVAVGGQRWRNL